MPSVDRVKLAYDTRATQTTDLNKMIETPRSAEQFAALIQDIRSKLELTSTNRLLDVGCGNANVLRSLKPLVSDAVGLDLSPLLLETAKTLVPTAFFFVAQAPRIPIADSTIDRVLTYSTFMHFPNQNYARDTILELCRVCKNDGLILIGDVPNVARRHHVVTLRWELQYRLKVLLRRHPGPSIFNPLQWQFYRMDHLAGFAEKLGHSARALFQPHDLLCANHRTDLLIRVHKRQVG